MFYTYQNQNEYILGETQTLKQELDTTYQQFRLENKNS